MGKSYAVGKGQKAIPTTHIITLPGHIKTPKADIFKKNVGRSSVLQYASHMYP